MRRADVRDIDGQFTNAGVCGRMTETFSLLSGLAAACTCHRGSMPTIAPSRMTGIVGSLRGTNRYQLTPDDVRPAIALLGNQCSS